MFLAHLVLQHVHVVVGSLRPLVCHLLEMYHQVGHVHPKLFTVRDGRHRVTAYKSHCYNLKISPFFLANLSNVSKMQISEALYIKYRKL